MKPDYELKGTTREIYKSRIKKISPQENNELALYELRCIGKGFLWHQIRSMMNILKQIGNGVAQPDIINILLDVENKDYEIYFSLEPGENLILYDCEYDENQV